MAIRVMLANDHRIFRAGSKSLLQRSHDVVVIAEADSGHDTVVRRPGLDPGIVVMDVAGIYDLRYLVSNRYPAIQYDKKIQSAWMRVFFGLVAAGGLSRGIFTIPTVSLLAPEAGILAVFLVAGLIA